MDLDNTATRKKLWHLLIPSALPWSIEHPLSLSLSESLSLNLTLSAAELVVLLLLFPEKQYLQIYLSELDSHNLCNPIKFLF